MRGSVVKRGAGYSIVYRAPDPATGRAKQVWRGGFATKREAERELTAVGTSLDAGTYVRSEKVTLRTFLERDWLPSIDNLVTNGTMKPSMASNYRSHVERHIVPRIGGVRLEAVTTPALNRLYADLLAGGRIDGKGGLSRSSVRLVHVTMSRALGDAVRWGKLARNVAKEADAPQADSAERTTWSGAQLRTFLAHVSEDRLSTMWFTFATTGLRRGEVAGLRWVDVDLEAGELRVAQSRVSVDYRVHTVAPKTRKGARVLSLDAATVASFRAHRARQAEERLAWGPGWTASGLIFVREDGSDLHPDTIRLMFQARARRAGLPPIRVHDLRHSYATAALEAGVDLKVLSERLGHATTGITSDTYQHVRRAVDARAADLTAAYILGS